MEYSREDTYGDTAVHLLRPAPSRLLGPPGLCGFAGMALQPPPGHGGQVPLFPAVVSSPSETLLHPPSVVSTEAVSQSYLIYDPGSTDSGQSTLDIVVPDAEDPEILQKAPLGVDQTSSSDVRVEHQSDQSDLEVLSASGVPVDQLTELELSLFRQMKKKTRAAITVLSSLIAYVSVNSFVKAVNPSAFVWGEEDKEEDSWRATSHSWWDRKACRWLGLCGLSHYRKPTSRFGLRKDPPSGQIPLEDNIDQSWRLACNDGKNDTESLDVDDRILREIPEYVLEYAPLVHLYSEEQFWPGDIAEHLYHITPKLNYTAVQPKWEHPTLCDLDELNQWQHGRYMFLTSNDNVEDRPPWLEGEKNIPHPVDSDPSGSVPDHSDGKFKHEIPDSYDTSAWWDVGEGSPRFEGGDRAEPDGPRLPVPADTSHGEDFVDEPEPQSHQRRSHESKRVAGRSDAPAVLIVVDKGNGVVDAFWFYFYSFNLGNVVLNVRFGNHVGDWEHSLVRFHNGKPKAIFFSEHSFGEAYSFEAVEKIGKRPVIYSATGTHAMYATPGDHAYILPWGLLHDRTDRGPLWDPVLNSHTYTYDYLGDTLRSSNITPSAPTEWFYFAGHWGDKFYPLSDSRQYRFAGQYHYVNGPLGPRFKNLGRRRLCPGGPSDPCVIKHWIGEERKAKRWVNVGHGEEISQEDLERFFGNGTTGGDM